MQSALWKIAALFSVIGVGSAVVYKVHDQLQLAQQKEEVNPNSFPRADADEGESKETSDTLVATGDPSNPFDAPPTGQSDSGYGTTQPLLAANDRNGLGEDSRSPFPERNGPSRELDADATANPFETVANLDPPETGPARLRRNAATTEDLSAAPTGVEPAGGGFGSEPDPSAPVVPSQDLPPGEGVRLAAAENPETTFAGPDVSANPFAAPADQSEPGTLSGSPLESPSLGNPADQGGLILPGTADDPGPTAGEAGNPFDTGAQSEAPAVTNSLDSAANPFRSADSTAVDTTAAAPKSGIFNPLAGSEPSADAVLPSDAGTTAGAVPLLELGAPQPAPVSAEQSTTNAEPQPAAAPGSSPAFGPGFNDAADPVPAAAGIEPQRLPQVVDDDGPPRPKTALRGHTAAPLAPPRNEPSVQIIPNPLPIQPGGPSPRPEFVGEATLDGHAVPGPQQPELTIQKVAPKNAAVGDPLVYAIRVKNIGNSTARDVIVEDRIPLHTTLEGTIPRAEMVDKKLIWQLGHMAPGKEETIRIKVVPTEPGEIGSVATVRFVAEVAATTKITTPNLTMGVRGPGEAVVGEQAVFHFHIVNAGDGEARNVYIRNLLPDGLDHPGGRDIEYEIGVLKPGETRDIDLAVKAAQEGPQSLRAILNTGTTQRAETETPVNVIKSRLLIQRQGPKRRFVGRPADYSTVVSNRSSTLLKGITVVEQLDNGLELAAVPEGGHFDQQRRTITWQIRELAPGAQTTLKTSLIAQQPKQRLESVVKASDASGNRAQLASHLEVAGFASLSLDLNHDGRPVGVGEQVALQLKVKNRGTGAAEGVEAAFEIPEQMEFVNADGPAEFRQEGRTVRFAALEELPANGEKTYKIVLTAREPGNTAVTAQLTTADGQPLQHTEQVIVEGDGP
ncbi:MAG: hypothetical protein U0992_19935 [Planctomycetaceae bacterium]